RRRRSGWGVLCCTCRMPPTPDPSPPLASLAGGGETPPQRMRTEQALHREGTLSVVVFGQFLEVLISGLLAGVLYSLVALGFVLIFKASGVFNFAQGSMVLLAGLALVRSLDWLVAKGFPVWTAIVVGLLFAAVIMA